MNYIASMRKFKRDDDMKTTKKHWKSIIRDKFCEKIPEKAIICNVDSGIEILESLRGLLYSPRPSIVIFPLLSDAEAALDMLPHWSEFAGEDLELVPLPETMSGEKFLPESEAERARAVYRAIKDDSSIFIASASGVFSPVPDPEDVATSSFTLGVGDYIKLDSERLGIVSEITLRHTIINNFENKRLIIPNAIISHPFCIWLFAR